MDLYKTPVRKLGVHVGIPEKLAAKPASPALWVNQKAEDELGIRYEVLDLILFGLERFMPSGEIAEQLGVEVSQVEDVKNGGCGGHKRRSR
jgi:NAD+ synthase